LVSIIIPFHNRIELLLKAINSVFHQTYNNWELILVNDYSTDDISDLNTIIKGPLGQSVLLINNSQNFGPGYSRNRGLEISTGQYICFLDSDDIILPDFLMETCKILSDNHLFVYTISNWEDGSVYKKSNINYTNVLPSILEFSRPWNTSSILWTKKYLDFYDENIYNWEDYLFEFNSALKNNSIQHVPKLLCIIGGVDDSNLSSYENTEKGLNDRIYALNKMFISLKGYCLPFKNKIYRLIIKKYCIYVIKVLDLNFKLNQNNITSRLKSIPLNKLVFKLIFKLTTSFD
jgi:glycosyltransferase involved in cell wall biosynthesis